MPVTTADVDAAIPSSGSPRPDVPGIHNLFDGLIADIAAVGIGVGVGTVNTFADLPAAASHSGERWWVLTSTGVWLVNRRTKGAYYSDGAAWSYLGDFPVTAVEVGNTPAGGIAASNVQAAINELDSEKAPLASPTFTGTVGGITKSMVGLGNVDNTSDANKPVSTATQALFDGRSVMARLSSTNTLTSTTASQAIFPSPSAVTLAVGVYSFDAIMLITSMSATSGNARVGVAAGTATIAAIATSGTGIDQATPSSTGAKSGQVTGSLTALGASPTVAVGLGSQFSGTFEVTVAGTVIPSIELATAAPAVVSVGSYFSITRVGSISSDRVGTWS